MIPRVLESSEMKGEGSGRRERGIVFPQRRRKLTELKRVRGRESG
jgi:hypothetical protein